MPSKIEWTDETWNPITGCTPVSEGCDHCYAKRMATRLRGRFGYPQDDPFAVTLHPDKLDEPLHWKKPRMVFVCSMGDLFHKDVPFSRIDDVVAVANKAWWRGHRFQFLTKRIDRALEYHLYRIRAGKTYPFLLHWLGITVENDKHYKRIEDLLRIRAAVRFVSVEPMIGPVDLKKYLLLNEKYDFGNLLNWVICGGETGPGARPMHPDWARDLRDQCLSAGVPFFFKQWGAWAPWDGDNWECPGGWDDIILYERAWSIDKTGQIFSSQYKNVTTTNNQVEIVRVGKKQAGRTLDGRTWDGMPGKINTEGTESTVTLFSRPGQTGSDPGHGEKKKNAQGK